MKLSKTAKALHYLDDDLIVEAANYQPPRRQKIFLNRKWQAAAACFLLLALIGGGFSLTGLLQPAPFTLYAYAMETETAGTAMKEGERVPLTLFETTDGQTCFVFSCDNPDQKETPSISLLSDENAIPDSYYMIPDVNYEIGLEDVGSVAVDPSQNYYLYFVGNPDTTDYILAFFIPDSRDDTAYKYMVSISQEEGIYYAELLEQSVVKNSEL